MKPSHTGVASNGNLLVTFDSPWWSSTLLSARKDKPLTNITSADQSTNVADHARKCAEIMVPPLSAFSHKSIARVLLHDWLEVMCPIEDPRR